MKLVSEVLVLLVTLGAAAIAQENAKSLFQKFEVDHGKVYSSAHERSRRFETFKRNLKKIKDHNETPDVTYKLGINQFADLSGNVCSPVKATA